MVTSTHENTTFQHLFEIKHPGGMADYRGCGKAWAAIDRQGNVLALRYMECREASEQVRVETPDRRCKTGIRVRYEAKHSIADQARIFGEFRRRMRAELEAVAEGVQISGGMVSCYEFMASRAIEVERTEVLA